MRTDRERYLASLIGSWRALATPHPAAAVTVDPSWVTMNHPDQVLCNGIVLGPGGVEPARRSLSEASSFALWCWDDDPATAGALSGAGFRPDTTTVPMLCDLGGIDESIRPIAVRPDADAVAELNGVGPGLLRGVPGLRGFVTTDGAAGLVLIGVGDEVNVSFVCTRPEARRQGLAGRLLRSALVRARDEGSRTASLQATPAGLGLYQTLGFRRVGTWQEWVPVPPADP